MKRERVKLGRMVIPQPVQEQPEGGPGRNRVFAAAGIQNVADIGGGQLAAAAIGERPGDGAHHIIQEAVAADADAD